MKKTIRLTESELMGLVKRVINEQVKNNKILNLLKSKGFVYHKYAEEWIYQNPNNFSIFIKPKDKMYIVNIVMGDPAEDMTKKGWSGKKGNLDKHPFTVMEKIVGKESRLDSSKRFLIIDETEVDESKIKKVLDELDKLKPYIGNRTSNPYR